MSAVVNKAGVVRQLDQPPVAGDLTNEDTVQDSGQLIRLILGMLKDIAALKRRFWPRRIDFEDQTVDASGTTLYRFVHKFGGRVRWWVVDWTGGITTAQLIRDSSSTNDVLVLVSAAAGTVTVRVEEAG